MSYRNEKKATQIERLFLKFMLEQINGIVESVLCEDLRCRGSQ